MTNYQIKLTVTTYFNTLIEENINEKSVKDFHQKDGELIIILEDNTVIKKYIRNFYGRN